MSGCSQEDKGPFPAGTPWRSWAWLGPLDPPAHNCSEDTGTLGIVDVGQQVQRPCGADFEKWGAAGPVALMGPATRGAGVDSVGIRYDMEQSLEEE